MLLIWPYIGHMRLDESVSGHYLYIIQKSKMMENISASENISFINENSNGAGSNKETGFNGRNSISPSIVSMIAEGGETFFRYLKNLGLSKEKNLMVLSSSHHYYYDENDLRSIKTLVNLKKLNMMKHLDTFLQTLIRILPQDANFVGCFSDNGSTKNRFAFVNPSLLFNRILNFLDSKTDYPMGRNEVAQILQAHGFEIVDMTEVNGVTYFYSKNVKKNIGLRA